MIDRACEDRLYRTPKFAGVIRYNVLKSCATRVCCACKDEAAGVAVMYLTLRISRERHGRKNPLPFPHFAAVTCRQSAPDPPRERGNSQEGGNRRCLPSCAPARRQRRFVRFASDYSTSIAAPTRPASLPSDAQTISVFRSLPRKVCGKVSMRSGSSSFSS